MNIFYWLVLVTGIFTGIALGSFGFWVIPWIRGFMVNSRIADLQKILEGERMRHGQEVGDWRVLEAKLYYEENHSKKLIAEISAVRLEKYREISLLKNHVKALATYDDAYPDYPGIALAMEYVQKLKDESA